MKYQQDLDCLVKAIYFFDDVRVLYIYLIFFRRNAMNEVYAHAVLGKHAHVVRYYSAWAEDDHMFIQNEYCNGK